ncbi:MAG TPA: response regulator transcription factor [Candidatus Udaeobacter sp.]|nr:response regulator transcription factor [Candidatus Udaeobacter sp.]
MISPKTLSVLVVHHAPVTRFGLTTLLKSSRGFKVVGETSSAPVARRLFTEIQPDLVILSLTLQHGDGISLLRDFRKMNPAARTLVLTAREDALSVQRAFRAGACGYIVTQDETSEVLQALERIAAGEFYVSATVARALLQMLARGSIETPRDRCAQLSDRELQVFRLIGSGLGTSRVAEELQLSIKTIETHRQHIKEKLGLTKAPELTRRAAEWMLAATRSRMKYSSLLLLTIANDFGFELVKLHEDLFQFADASLVMATF